jgi:hypothetical protein
MLRRLSIGCVVFTLALAGCQSVYYKTMKTLGKEKRDILVQRIKDSKKDQEQAKEQLKTTMESFQELTGFQGGSLEKTYKKLDGDYQKAADQSNKLHQRIESIDQVSGDLFKEWQKEIGEMRNMQLKSRSNAMLRDAKDRQASYMRAMHKTEDQMTPVLTSFRDQVLFLKHNLNARAIGSLKGTSASINNDVSALLKTIDASMQEADQYIATLGQADKS